MGVTKSAIKSPDQRRAELATELLNIKQHWPYSERSEWCNRNGYNPESIRKLYLMGAVNSIPVAENIRDTIREYMKKNKIAA